jgi:hypothetical protein
VGAYSTVNYAAVAALDTVALILILILALAVLASGTSEPQKPSTGRETSDTCPCRSRSRVARTSGTPRVPPVFPPL